MRPGVALVFLASAGLQGAVAFSTAVPACHKSFARRYRSQGSCHERFAASAQGETGAASERQIPRLAGLEHLGTDEVKAELSKRGLDDTGRKTELLARLGRALGVIADPAATGDDDQPATTPSETFIGHSQQPAQIPDDDADALVGARARQAERRGFLRLAPEARDMQERTHVDLLHRRIVKFPSPSSEEGSDMYVVATRRALRPRDPAAAAAVQASVGKPDAKSNGAASRSKGPKRGTESHAVLLLPDVRGWSDVKTRRVADDIAFVCDSVVAVPDLFSGRPWQDEGPSSGPNYEAWRDSHDASDVSGLVRAAAMWLRNEYSPATLGLLGFCYGGGRALEEAAAAAASGAGAAGAAMGAETQGVPQEAGTVATDGGGAAKEAPADQSEQEGVMLVQPDAVVAFYPTRYDVAAVAAGLSCPTVALFAEHDSVPGATIEDARLFKQGLAENERVRDFMVRVFRGQRHGFAHRPGADVTANHGASSQQLSAKDAANDAMLLATAWLDIYLQKTHRTAGRRAKSVDAFLI